MLSGQPRRGRRGRRGLSLVEMAMSLAIGAIVVDLTMDVAQRHIRAAAVQAEARALSEVADLARGHAGRDLPGLTARLRTATGRIEWITEANLRATGFVEVGRPFHTVRGRDISLAAWMPTGRPREQRVVLAVWADTPAGWAGLAAPRIREGTALVGRVGDGQTGCAANRFCGPGLDWDATDLLTALGVGGPQAGDMVALRLLHPAADRDPFLHRQAVTGRPELNEVDGDFTMNGGDLRDVARLEVDRIRLEQNLTVTGTVEAGSADIAANVEIGSGGVTVQAIAGSGPALTATGQISGQELAVDSTIDTLDWTSAELTVEGVLITGDLEVTGILAIEAGSIPGEAAGTLSAAEITATGLAGLGALRAESASAPDASAATVIIPAAAVGYAGSLTTPACSGC